MLFSDSINLRTTFGINFVATNICLPNQVIDEDSLLVIRKIENVPVGTSCHAFRATFGLLYAYLGLYPYLFLIGYLPTSNGRRLYLLSPSREFRFICIEIKD